MKTGGTVQRVGPTPNGEPPVLHIKFDAGDLDSLSADKCEPAPADDTGPP